MAQADGSVIIDIKGDASDITKSLKSSIVSANLVTDAIKKSASALLDFAKSSISVGMNFDSSMAQVAATMGKTVDEIQDLRDFAMDMGAKTAFSATEAADALNYMALAGYDAETSMKMLPNVLNLAAAGGIELASASDMVTDAQSALGLTLDETTELVDKMAMASSKSNTSVAQMGEAILTVGGTAKNLAGGTTELATAIGILADNGVKGAEGGTALRNIILSLSAPTDKAAKSLKTLGVEVFDAEGNMRPLNETFGDLNDALASMTQGERTQVLSDIFNKVDLKSAEALLANTGERFDELSGYIDKARGSAEQMAQTQLDNLAGDITLAQSALEGLQISLSSKVDPMLRNIVQMFTEVVGEANEFIGDGGIEGIISALKDMIPVVSAATGVFVSFKAGMAIQRTVQAFQQAQVTLSLLTMEIGKANIAQAALNGTLKIGETVVALLTGKLTIAALAEAALAKAQAALNAVMAANPIGLVVAAVGSLAAVTVALTIAEGDANKETKKLLETVSGSAKKYKELTESIDSERGSLESTAQSLMDLLSAEERTAAQNEVIKQKVAELNEAIPTLGLAYDELSGSINMSVNELNRFIQSASGEDEHAAQVERLSELYSQQTEISEQLAEAEEKLAAAKEKNTSAANRYVGSVADTKETIGQLEGNVRSLTDAYENNAAEIKDLEEKTNSYIEQTENSTDALSGMEAKINGITSSMDALSAAYEESYSKAYESISDQVGLFTELDGSAKASIDDLIGTLKGQVQYMDEYAENIKKAMELGVNEGLVQALSDGKEEHAQILAAIVAGGEGKIDELNAEFAKVAEGKEAFSNAVGEMETNFSGAMDQIVSDLNDAVGGMDFSGELTEIGESNIQGLIDGTNSNRQALIDTYKSMAQDALDAARNILDGGSGDNVGENLSSGIAKGIDTSAKDATNSAKKMAKEIVSSTQKELGINSPSKVMRDEVGRYIGEGIAAGISDSNKAVENETGKLGQSIVTGLTNGIKGMSSATKSAGKDVLDAISGAIKSLPQTLITIGKNGINGLINGIKSMRSSLGGTVKTVASTVVDTFKALPGKMLQIGKDILTGIWNGISDKVGWLKQQVSGVVDKIKSWFTGKKGFDTHSPSKWGEQVGEYVGQGLGNGFEKSTAAAVKSAEQMGTAVQDAIVESVDRAKKAGDKSLSEFYDGWSDQAINAWTDYRRYGAFDLNAFYQSGSPYGYNPIEAGFWGESTHTDLYKGWTFYDWDYRSKNWDPLAAIEAAQKELQWGYDNFEAYAKANMSAPGNMPKELASTIVPWLDDDKIREKAKAMGIDLSEALNEGAGEAGQSSFDERFEAMRSQLEKETKYRKLSLQEQYKGWKYIQDQYEADSGEYIEAEKQMESLRESIYDDYLEKVRDTLENIVDLEENYQNELKSRTAEIQKTYGLFGRVPEREVVSADYITRTLQGQIATMEEFYANLDKLSERGAPTELVDQLRDLGVDAVDEVAAITGMTDKELEKYVDLFQQKNKLAVDQATKELAPLREETDQKIMEQLQSATDLYNQNVALVGDAFTDGLAESIRAGMNDVAEAAQDVIRASMRAAGMETGAYFPTKSEVLGSYDIKDTLAKVEQKMRAAVEETVSNVSAEMTVSVNSAETKKKLEGNSARIGLADPGAGWNSAAQPREVVLNVNGIPLARTLLPDIRAAESETPAIRDDPQGVIPLAQRIS